MPQIDGQSGAVVALNIKQGLNNSRQDLPINSIVLVIDCIAAVMSVIVVVGGSSVTTLVVCVRACVRACVHACVFLYF